MKALVKQGWILGVVGSSVIAGCVSPLFLTAGNSSVAVESSLAAVCDPLGGDGGSGSASLGLYAQLYYLTDSMPRYTSVSDYIQNGVQASVNIFFSDLDVPTRLFNEGFQTQGGSLLTDQDGNTLYEYFALHFNSVIGLSASDPEGKYQFAVLSDDGAIFSIDENGLGLNPLINNDGTHPSLFGCAPHSISMTHATQLPMQLDYYQGPRFEIALMLLWREIPADVDETLDPSVLEDVACGQEGNYTFFDPNQSPSAPQATWIQMLARGWKVLQPANYSLPPSVSSPCPGPSPSPSPVCTGISCGVIGG